MRLIKSATMTYKVLGMKLYRITHDSQDDYVEAPDFATAVLTWREHKLALWKRDGDYEEGDKKVEPEGVELMHDEPVIRRQHFSEQVASVRDLNQIADDLRARAGEIASTLGPQGTPAFLLKQAGKIEAVSRASEIEDASRTLPS